MATDQEVGADRALVASATKPVSRLGPTGGDHGDRFTPGPWWFSPHGAYNRMIAGEKMPFGYIEAEEYMPIFELDTVHRIKRAELVANAHLIAATPDLYAFAESSPCFCEDGDDQFCRRCVVLEKARNGQ